MKLPRSLVALVLLLSPAAARTADPAAPELTPAAFRLFARQRSGDLRRCYEAALAKDQTLRGKLTLTFSVLPGGALSAVRVSRSTLRSPAVGACVAAVVRAWRTPFRPAEPVAIEYPIDLRPR